MDAWKGNDMQDEKKPKKIRILAAVLGGLAAALLVLYCAYRVWERPPEIEATPEPAAEDLPVEAEPAEESGEAPAEGDAEEAEPEPEDAPEMPEANPASEPGEGE